MAAKSTTVYIAVAYLTDEEGRHEFGDPVEIPSASDEEKDNLARLLDHGIVTIDRPQPQAATEPPADPDAK